MVTPIIALKCSLTMLNIYLFALHIGNLHVQIATSDNRALAFLTNDFSLPKHQWMRLMLTCDYQQVETPIAALGLFGFTLRHIYRDMCVCRAVDILVLISVHCGRLVW